MNCGFNIYDEFLQVRELRPKTSLHESSNDDDEEKLNGGCDTPSSLAIVVEDIDITDVPHSCFPPFDLYISQDYGMTNLDALPSPLCTSYSIRSTELPLLSFDQAIQKLHVAVSMTADDDEFQIICEN
ncbi:hypothetical protein Tco_0747809 [Tanacetum coccineum]|uniref:Uncharacterized protein n=1 Tax=Tanacetum coccineum TaxID=301880 RepID=A0ABQ4YTR5_9ASTR